MSIATGETAAPGSPPPGLSRLRAIPLAIGSVAGSGMLVLPSAVYAEACNNNLLVWLAATGLCLPMLLMFADIVRAQPDGNSIESCITAGLGATLGRCVPVMFVCLVSVGLPAGAMVAGRYVSQALGANHAVQIVIAAGVLLAALAVNLAGARANTAVQLAGATALVLTALVLICSSIPALGGGAPAIIPDFTDLGAVLPGVVLAFWAFAGFENLTFLSRQFRAPERDFLPVSSTALGVYGVLTAALTAALALRVPRVAVDETAGLLQLAEHAPARTLVISLVTAIAVAAMVLNAVSWIWGVGQLVVTAGRTANLPARLAARSPRGVPRYAIGLLAALFSVSTAVLAVVPGLLVDALAAASATFIVLYLLCIVSYTRMRGLTWRSAANLLVLVVLVASLLDSGWRSLYGLLALGVALAVQGAQSRARAVQKNV